MKKEQFILYPAIDIKDGKCVRLLFGDMRRETVYNNNPIDQAMWFIDQGAKWLHIVDLDGAVEGKSVNKTIIKKLSKTFQNGVNIQLGGGIRNRENIDFWLQNSVERLILGTFAQNGPKRCCALDVKRYSFKEFNKLFSNIFTIVKTQNLIHRTPFETEQSFNFIEGIKK